MYSNVFDTVRTEPIDLINCEGLLYSSIINGMHPTLSLNQAIDSKVLMNLIQNDSNFLKFIEDGYIRVALYGKYKGEKNEIVSFLKTKLSECINSERASFRFSSLSFLNSERYSDKQLLAIYSTMLGKLENEKMSISTLKARDIGIDANSEGVEKIETYLYNIKKIEDAVNGHYILPPKTKTKETLYEKLKKEFKIYKKEVKDDDLCLCIKDIQKILDKEKLSQKVNSRSFIYEIIENTLCSEKNMRELKAMVDLCYNEVVAASIADDEHDIMVTEHCYEYAQVWTNNIDKDSDIDRVEQKLSLVRKIREVDSKYVSWELLKNILDEAHLNSRNTESWYSNMEKYTSDLEKIGIKLNRKIKGEKLLVATVPFIVTVVVDITLQQLFDNNGDKVVRDSVIENIPGQIGGYIANLIAAPTIEETEKELYIIQKKHDTINQLLTQTSLLKKDYGR